MYVGTFSTNNAKSIKFWCKKVNSFLSSICIVLTFESKFLSTIWTKVVKSIWDSSLVFRKYIHMYLVISSTISLKYLPTTVLTIRVVYKSTYKSSKGLAQITCVNLNGSLCVLNIAQAVQIEVRGGLSKLIEVDYNSLFSKSWEGWSSLLCHTSDFIA